MAIFYGRPGPPQAGLDEYCPARGDDGRAGGAGHLAPGMHPDIVNAAIEKHVAQLGCPHGIPATC